MKVEAEKESVQNLYRVSLSIKQLQLLMTRDVSILMASRK